jgi:hypothetical protein
MLGVLRLSALDRPVAHNLQQPYATRRTQLCALLNTRSALASRDVPIKVHSSACEQIANLSSRGPPAAPSRLSVARLLVLIRMSVQELRAALAQHAMAHRIDG